MEAYYQDKKGAFYLGDSLEVLKTFPSETIDCCITSPPYWGLRDYGTAKWEGGDPACDHKAAKEKSRYDYSLESSPIQRPTTGTDAPKWKDICPVCGAKKIDKQLGLESAFQEYISKLCDMFDEVKRVLKPTGTCWVNLGDTYGGSGGDSSKVGQEQRTTTGIDTRPVSMSTEGNRDATKGFEKCLMQIPSHFSIEMVRRGWILRNEIIWYKRNCMPTSVTDRFTVDFEKIFFFVKNKRYYFEQQLDKFADERMGNPGGGHNSKFAEERPDMARLLKEGWNADGKILGRNKRCVWDICPKPFKDAHFAVFPPELVETPLKAGCPDNICKKCGKPREKIYELGEVLSKGGSDNAKMAQNKDSYMGAETKCKGIEAREHISKGLTDCGCNAGFEPGVVLDPFLGSGTTAMVAKYLGRRFIGIDLNEKYLQIAKKRVAQDVLF